MDDLSLIYIRIFIDECISSLFEDLQKEFPDYDYTDPGLLPGIDWGAKDKEWIRVVGERGMIAITKDNKIIRNQDELRSIIDYGARIILLPKTKGLFARDLFGMLKDHWDTISGLFQTPGPWVIRIMIDHRRGSVHEFYDKCRLRAMLKE